MIKALADYLAVGNYIDTACALVGISEPSFYGWFNRGQEEQERLDNSRQADPKAKESEANYLEFFKAITRARSLAEAAALQRIRKAATGGDEVRTKSVTKTTALRVGGTVVLNDFGDPVYVTETTEEVHTPAPRWEADAWFLERTKPKKYGRQRIELTGDGGGPVQTVGLSLEDWERIKVEQAKLAESGPMFNEDEL